MKLDIEGAEMPALEGAADLLQQQVFRYIQLEYNHTWLKAGVSMESLLKLCRKYGYDLYRITNRGLVSIPRYHSILDDFFYCNLLLCKSGELVPAKVLKKALPFL